MRKVTTIFWPVLAGIVFLLLWQLQVFHFLLHIQIRQLPLPSAMIETLIDNWQTLLLYSMYTLAEATLGMLIGSAIGFLLAVIATVFPKWGYGGLIFVTALNAVPIIALAPIMNLWFGDGLGSRAAVVTITTMAAMALNAYRGLNDLKPYALDLMKSYAANESVVFRCLRLPNCLPNVITALKINTTASMIGAIVSEFFYSSRGLGYMLSNSVKIAKMSMGWACIILSAILGILLYSIVRLIEKHAIKWHVSQRI